MFGMSELKVHGWRGEWLRKSLAQRPRSRRRATTWSRFPVAVECYETRQVLSPVLLSLNPLETPAQVMSVASVVSSASAVAAASERNTAVAAQFVDQPSIQASSGLSASVAITLPTSSSNSSPIAGGIAESQGLKVGLDVQVTASIETSSATASPTSQVSASQSEALMIPVLYVSFNGSDITARMVFVRLDVTVEHVSFSNDVPRIAASFNIGQPTTSFAMDATKSVRSSTASTFASTNVFSSFVNTANSTFSNTTTDELQERSRPPLRHPPDIVEVQITAIPRPAFEQLASSPLPTHSLIDPSFFGMIPAAPLDVARQTTATVLPAPLNPEALLSLASGLTRSTVVSPQLTTETSVVGTSDESSPMPEAALVFEEPVVVPEIALLPPIPADLIPDPGPWAWMRDPKVWVAGILAIATSMSCWIIERKHRATMAISGMKRR